MINGKIDLWQSFSDSLTSPTISLENAVWFIDRALHKQFHLYIEKYIYDLKVDFLALELSLNEKMMERFEKELGYCLFKHKTAVVEYLTRKVAEKNLIKQYQYSFLAQGTLMYGDEDGYSYELFFYLS